MVFRINAKCLFLTYSQSDLTKDEIVDNLKLFFEEVNKEIEWYVVGEELHADDGTHFHIIVMLKEAYDCKNQFAFDRIGGGDGKGGKDSNDKVVGHGKYEATRNKNKVLQYCIKDGDYVEDGIDAKEYINARTKKKSTIYATKLRDEEMSVKDLIKDDPEFYMNHKRKVDDFVSSVKKIKNEEEFKKIIVNKLKPYGWQKEAITLLENQDDRSILWIYETEGKSGKSDLAKWLHANKGAFLARGGKVVDITYSYNYETIVVFDIPRESNEFINYALIEMFKDGVIQSNKFDSKIKYKYGIKAIVLANIKPSFDDKLSKDRIQLYEIENKTRLVKINIE